MFNKILIANRGEIACRIIKTASHMGIKTVAIYTHADRYAKHVMMADEAAFIGDHTPNGGYLNHDHIIETALTRKVEAIHPGYGFLSENPNFVEKLSKSGLVFIGPTAHTIRQMGHKDIAKALMQKVGVPTIPGYHGNNQDDDYLKAKADEIGYPVLIKARAGGGGRGMRKVKHSKDFLTALQSARREAFGAFNDQIMLIEKYVSCPRHIEFQIFADQAGNIIHLFERDCSIQRRYQKIIEEAPAPGMNAKQREIMGQAAIKAAKAVNYCGAGTVEFLVDGSKGLHANSFWFMEMNTRLQVEHPISEAITGLDFVELQLRIAYGEKLKIKQSDLTINGHAIEVRLCAESPSRGFLPASGTLHHLNIPYQYTEFTNPQDKNLSLRIDSGVKANDEISLYYDSMIAKIITHADHRSAAIKQMQTALANFEIAEIATNINFLQSIMTHKHFIEDLPNTGFIDQYIDQLLKPIENSDQPAKICSMIASGLLSNLKRTCDHHACPWDRLKGWSNWIALPYHINLVNNDQIYHLDLQILDRHHYLIGGQKIRFYQIEDQYIVDFGKGGQKFSFYQQGEHITLFWQGYIWNFSHFNQHEETDISAPNNNRIIAPMAGIISKIMVKKNQTVDQDTPLILMEAMKMEYTLKAPKAAKVEQILVQETQQISDGECIMILD
ncbi:MAG: biotin carboxylase N-terminal domain-containing protein [Pseudomonadota bacterium]